MEVYALVKIRRFNSGATFVPRSGERGPPLLRVRSLSLFLSWWLSRALDEPVNPRKRERESSPVNAEVMTGVATLKDPRQSAIASAAASRSSSRSPLLPSSPLSFSLVFFVAGFHVFSCQLASPSSFDNGDGRHACSAHSAVNHGQREAERARASNIKLANLPLPICIGTFRQSPFLPKPAHWLTQVHQVHPPRPISRPGPSEKKNKISNRAGPASPEAPRAASEVRNRA